MIHQLLFSSEVSLSGQETFTSPTGATSSSTFSWVVPSGVTTICAVCVGGGGAGGLTTGNFPSGGGGGGGLSWLNDIPVTPGETLSVTAGVGGYYDVPSASADGGDSGIQRGSTILLACTGGEGATPGQPSGGGQGGASLSPQWGGGDGGNWLFPSGSTSAGSGGGGGAGGYSGDGGRGGYFDGFGATAADTNSGGGGGGYGGQNIGGGGGGVGLLGKGSDGSVGTSPLSVGGGGGSGGQDGLSTAISNDKTQATGGLYGGGGFGRPSGNPGAGAPGAVRIIWGPGRAFPSTNTADV